MTGDNRTTAEALAEELDLPKDRILAGVLPKDKVTKVSLTLSTVFCITWWQLDMFNCKYLSPAFCTLHGIHLRGFTLRCTRKWLDKALFLILP